MPRLQTDSKTMYCHILIILFTIGDTFCHFLPVHDGCKYWDYLKVFGNGGDKHLHCILDQDFQPGLVYADVKIIPKGKCPIYNRHAKQIDIIPCKNNYEKCPQVTIPSYAGVTYSGCYDAIRKGTNVTIPIRTKDGISPPIVSINNSNQTTLAVISTMLAISACMHIVLCFRYYICRGAKDRSVTKEEIEAMITSDAQQKYLTKEEIQEMITNGLRNDKKRTPSSLRSYDAQQKYLTKEEIKEMITNGLRKDKRKTPSSLRSYDTGMESDRILETSESETDFLQAQ